MGHVSYPEALVLLMVCGSDLGCGRVRHVTLGLRFAYHVPHRVALPRAPGIALGGGRPALVPARRP